MKHFAILIYLSLCSANSTILAQSCFFHNISKESNKAIVLPVHRTAASEVPTNDTPTKIADAATHPSKKDIERYSSYSIEELEKLIDKYETMKATKKTSGKARKIHHFYEGKSKKLNIPNLIDVMLEAEMKEPIFVLAQAILETGYFSSNVCRNYNNLFGLYDSSTKDYFMFERWEDSVIGYIKFIQYRYEGGNYIKFLDKIGYAEDPHYTSKVKKLAKQISKQLKKQYIKQ